MMTKEKHTLEEMQAIVEDRCVAAIEREKFNNNGFLSDHDKLANHRLDRAIRTIREGKSV